MSAAGAGGRGVPGASPSGPSGTAPEARVREWPGREALAVQLAATQERYRTLFETMPQGVIYDAADGRIIEANPAASAILGVDVAPMRTWPLVMTGGAVREDGTSFAPEEFPVRVALRTGAVVPDVVMGVQHGHTGELRWLRVTAVPDASTAPAGAD